MSRAQLLTALLLLLIVLLFSTISLLGKSASKGEQQTTTPITSGESVTDLGKNFKDGNYFVDKEESTFTYFKKINKIVKIDERVIAETSEGEIIIFDKGIAPFVAMTVFPSRDLSPGAEKTYQIFNSADLFEKKSLFEGKLAKFNFSLKNTPYKQEGVLECNNNLLKWLKGEERKIDCHPFSAEIIGYEK